MPIITVHEVRGRAVTIRHLLRAVVRPSLGLQVIGVAALIALVGGGVVGVVVSDRARSALRENILNNSLGTADLAGALTASYMGDAEASARELASRPSLRAAAAGQDFRSITVDLDRWAAEHANVMVAVNDLDGATRATSYWDKTVIGQRKTAEDWFRGAVDTDRPFLGTPGVSSITNRARVPYGIPLRDEAGTTRGVLLASIELNGLSSVITSIHVGQNARASMNDLEHGVILAHPDPTRILTASSGKNAATIRMQARERGVIEDTSSSGQWPAIAIWPGRLWSTTHRCWAS
jgi:hypothetical protein